MHVFFDSNIGTNTDTSASAELRRTLSMYPSILRYACHLDVYRPWTQEAYVTIAERWLQDHSDRVISTEDMVVFNLFVFFFNVED